MNSTNTKEKPATDKKAQGNQTPAWWTDSLETSWNKAKAATIEGWDKVVQKGQKLNHQISEKALALGHSGRELYPKFTTWTSELEDKLRPQWEQMQATAEAAWDKVRDAVKHGWESAKQSSPAGAKSSHKTS